ncbi:MAG TPA: amino acid ABC transporter permease [Gaiellaceae bacterium]|nr:amino acid ABC transporter permease [Gaiellaceae bacterium]
MPELPDWVEPVARYMLDVGLRNTLRTAAISVVLATGIGVVLGTLITIRFRLSRALIRGYIEIWRGLPIIVTLFIVHFGLPALSPRLEFDVFTSGIITLTLWGSAQIAEATRGAVQSIPREQHEASSALGFGWVGRHRYIIFPQALRRLIPPLVGLIVGIILNTTLIQVIGGSELLETAEQSIERLGSPPPVGLLDPHAFEILGAVAVVFFVICFPLTRLAAYLEKRLVA